MYLNVRKPPLRSKLPLNPLTFLFPRTAPSRPQSPPPTARTPRGTPTTIPPIPHTTNPRGELIFSSRVDRSFRDSYERYRSAFERKRDERQRLADARTWWGWFILKMPWSEALLIPTNAANSHARSHSASIRGRGTGSSGPTPSSSRRPSPVPRIGGSGHKQSSSRSGTPPVRLTPTPERTRIKDT